MCRTQHLALNLMQLISAHWSRQSRSIWRALLSSSRSTLPPKLVLPANLLGSCCLAFFSMIWTYSFKSSINVLNRTSPSTEPCGTLLAAYWIQFHWPPFSGLGQTVFHPTKGASTEAWAAIYYIRMLWGTVARLFEVWMDTIHSLSLMSYSLPNVESYHISEP